MSDKAEVTQTQEAVEVHHGEHDEHHAQSFWRTYIFSTDHKIIGIQYGFCGLAFLFFGFCLGTTRTPHRAQYRISPICWGPRLL